MVANPDGRRVKQREVWSGIYRFEAIRTKEGSTSRPLGLSWRLDRNPREADSNSHGTTSLLSCQSWRCNEAQMKKRKQSEPMRMHSPRRRQGKSGVTLIHSAI